MRRLLVALALPLVASLGVHVALAWMVPQMKPRARPPREVHVTVAKTPRPPPEVKPVAPAPPPPQAPRDAPTVVPDRPRRAAATPQAPPPPPHGFSVDERNTVADGEGPEVAAREGGGNMFADPGDGLAPGELQLVAPEPPPPPPPPPPPEAPGKVEPPSWITPADQRSPPYPRSALRAEVEGQVLLRVCVGTRGTVDSVEVVKGLGAGCDEAAAAWARERWRFRPARQGDRAISMCIQQPVRFELQR